jgi:hypothetical protein
LLKKLPHSLNISCKKLLLITGKASLSAKTANLGHVAILRNVYLRQCCQLLAVLPVLFDLAPKKCKRDFYNFDQELEQLHILLKW